MIQNLFLLTFVFFAKELAAPTLKSRTINKIIVNFLKLPEDANQLSYSVAVTGMGAPGTPISCESTLSECTVPNLSPGEAYDFTITSCIIGVTPDVCSAASAVATIEALPKGKLHLMFPQT